MNEIELIVGQIIPDTTAITAFHTLENMGYKGKLNKLKRERYYMFEVDESFDKFAKAIAKVDVLVNANKDRAVVKKPEEELKEESAPGIYSVRVLVTDTGDKIEGLLRVLRDRLGFSHIHSVKRGILWTLSLNVKSKEEAKSIAGDIAKKLLYNENYQKCDIF